MKSILILLFLIPSIILGQKLNDTLVVSFYNKSLSQMCINPDDENFQNVEKPILIKTDLAKDKLIQSNGKCSFQFFERVEDLGNFIKKPYGKKSVQIVYELTYKTFGKDTVDIILTSKVFTPLNRRSFYFASLCGGGNGYIPYARFIYNNETKNWVYISAAEIISQKSRRRENNNRL